MWSISRRRVVFYRYATPGDAMWRVKASGELSAGRVRSGTTIGSPHVSYAIAGMVSNGRRASLTGHAVSICIPPSEGKAFKFLMK